MAGSTSPKRESLVLAQTLLGVAVCLFWLLIGMAFEEDLASSVMKVVPYFAAYELGVLSRYVPGLPDWARRLRSSG